MELSPGQDKALLEVKKWYENWSAEDRPFFYLAGYAGTGKTTIESKFTDDIEGRVVRCAYTGKAAMRLQQVSGKQASTIHAAAYRVRDDGPANKKNDPVFELDFERSPIVGAKLLVLDECSMVNAEMGEDLLKFGVPILVLGDPGQLPPVKGTGFFTKRRPDAMLTEVHRQALDSPIIRVATSVREGKPLSRMNEDGAVIYPFAKDFDYDQELMLADQVLTGKNLFRQKTNRHMRELYGRGDGKDMPVVEDKVICLKNSRRDLLFNGLLGEITNIQRSKDDELVLDVLTEMGQRNGLKVMDECFTDPEWVQSLPYRDRRDYAEFDYGYCLTVHKSQGSQWDKVTLLDDGFLSWKKDARKQWLYTAVTRAAERLVVLNSKGR